MPVHKTKDGKFQYGETGKKYASKKDAIKQALAIAYSKAKKHGRKPTNEEISAEITGTEKMLNKHAADNESSIKTARDAAKKAVSEDDPFTDYKYNIIDSLAYLAKNTKNYNTNLSKVVVPLLARYEFRDDSGLGRDLAAKVRQIKDVHGRLLSDAKKTEALNRGAKSIGALTNEGIEEFDANADTWQAIKLRGPSYLASTLAGAAIGRLLSGKKHRWWGYGIGGLVGAGLNYARRKAYYGGVHF